MIFFLNIFKRGGQNTGGGGGINVPKRTMASSLVVLELQNFLILVFGLMNVSINWQGGR